MLAVASLKRSLEFDPVEQGVKRKRAELKLSSSTHLNLNASLSPSKQQQQQQQQPILSPTRSTSPKISKSSSASSTDDTPMFTSAQTAQMCARLLREQDQSIRQQYDELLKSKLTEQYETFIRYSHDSVHKPRPNISMLFNYNEHAQESKQQMDFSYVS